MEPPPSPPLAIGTMRSATVVPAQAVLHDGRSYQVDHPLGRIVEKRCRDAGLRGLVTLGVVDDGNPNAFTFGHHRGDARVWVTTGLLDIFIPGLGSALTKTTNPIARPIVDKLDQIHTTLKTMSTAGSANAIAAPGLGSIFNGGGSASGGGFFGHRLARELSGR